LVGGESILFSFHGRAPRQAFGSCCVRSDLGLACYL
jgi:hypothetical protein